jgi:hypothetical protein
METSSVTGSGNLPASLQLPAAQIRLMKKVTEVEGQGALQLIQALAPANVPDHVGRNLNVVG